MGEFKYYAFISYSHSDKKTAKWLQHKIEYYRLPVRLKKEMPHLPTRVRPIFRDETDLDVGFLDHGIRQALDLSKYLIVICSNDSVKSQWVDSEIDYFALNHPKENILPFIINFPQNTNKGIENTYPKALQKFHSEKELLGADIGALGKEASVIKIISRLLDVRFDVIWGRYRRDQAQKRFMAILLALIIGISGIVFAYVYRHQRDVISNQDLGLLINQSRFIAKEAEELISSNNSFLARRILAEALPIDLNSPNRPYVSEAGIILRKAFKNNSFVCGVENDVNRAVISKDNSIIVIGDANGVISIIDVSNGSVIKTKKPPNGFIYDLDLDPNGSCVAYISEGGLIMVWNWKEDIDMVSTICEGVSHIRFLSSNNTLISSNNNGRICIWSSTPELHIIKSIDSHRVITSMECSPKGEIIIGDSSGEIVIMDAYSLKTKRIYHAHKDVINDCKITSSGRFLISASNDSTCLIHDMKSLMPDTRLSIGDVCTAIDMSPDDKKISIGAYSGIITIWDWIKRKNIKSIDNHTDYVSSLIFSKNDELLVSSSWDNTVSVFDFCEREPECEIIDCPDTIVASTFIPNNKIVLGLNGGKVSVLDILTKQIHEVCTLPFVIKKICSAGEDMVIGSTDSSLVSINLISGEVLESTVKVGGITDLDVNLKSSLIVTSAKDKTVILFDLITLSEIRHFKGHTDMVKTVKFNHKGDCILTISDDLTFRTWDVSSGRRIIRQTFNDELAGGVFSVDDTSIVVGTVGGLLYRYNLKGGLVSFFSAHEKLLNIVYSKGNLIATAALTESVKIWDNGTELDKVGNTSWTSQLSISDDGDYMLTLSSFGVLKLWHFSSVQQLINKTHKQFLNNHLTLEERRKYYLE